MPHALIVDDEEGSLFAMQTALAGAGYRVSTAADGRGGMDQIRAHEGEEDPVSLIITDINMPGMDGLSFIHAARKARPEIPVIVITGYADKGLLAELVRLGVDEFLDKPARVEELREKAAAVLSAEERRRGGEEILRAAKAYFTSIASHELRAPLVKIALSKGMLENLEGVLHDPEAAERLETAKAVLASCQADFERILSSTSLLLELARGERSGGTEPMAALPALKSCVEAAREKIRENGRAVELRLDITRLPPSAAIRCDPAMFQRALNEILSNAIKRTPDGKGVFIEGKIEGRLLEIEARDEGIGVLADKEALVTEPYFSLENPNTHFTGMYKFKSGGMGLGLALAALIAKSRGGGLKVQSRGGSQGTSVALAFPLAD